MRRAVFLDRDGVLNHLVMRNGRAVAPRMPSEFTLLPGVGRALETLRRAALLTVVVTNQPDVARGALTAVELQRMHARLCRAVPIDAIYVCPHDDSDGCACRKPKPGLFWWASRDWNISLPDSFMVGDTWKDIAAGQAAGCATILIATPECQSDRVSADLAACDLPAAAELILEQLGKRCIGPMGGLVKPRNRSGAAAYRCDVNGGPRK
jgi:D-glycero-D-manno-heptose 1,7-bisphosphate phosphatase